MAVTTNCSLAQPVSDGFCENTDINNRKAITDNADILEKILTGAVVIATNASIVNTAGNAIVKLYACSAGSIATVTGMVANIPFNLLMMSSGASLALLAAGTNRCLTADWVPNAYGGLRLIWDGTNLREINR